MSCPHCYDALRQGSHSCDVCGAPAAVYAPPEGFALDSQSLLYYRSETVYDPQTGAAVQWVTWFDSKTGEYQQTSYPQTEQQSAGLEPEPQNAEESETEQTKAGVAAVPAAQPAVLPMAEPVSEGGPPVADGKDEPAASAFEQANIPSPEPFSDGGRVYDAPAGFEYDQSSGLYFTAAPGTDPNTGRSGEWITWFYPQTGGYEQTFAPAPQDVFDAEARPSLEAKQKISGGGKKRGLRVLLIVLPIAALLAGVFFAVFELGGFELFSKQPVEISRDIRVAEPNLSNNSVFLPQVIDSQGDLLEQHFMYSYFLYDYDDSIEGVAVVMSQEWEDDLLISDLGDVRLLKDGREIPVSFMQYGSSLSYYAVDDEKHYYLFFTSNLTERGDYSLTFTLGDMQCVSRDGSIYYDVAVITLNYELLSLLGQTNDYLISVNGGACESYFMHGGMVADYTGRQNAAYPTRFFLDTDEWDEVQGVLDRMFDGYGNALLPGQNVWDGHFTIGMINVGGEYLNHLFQSNVPLTPDNMNAGLWQTPELEFYPLESQDFVLYDFDYWQSIYYYGGYTIMAAFYEKGGEIVLFDAMIWWETLLYD